MGDLTPQGESRQFFVDFAHDAWRLYQRRWTCHEARGKWAATTVK
jgi:hypothetical protein